MDTVGERNWQLELGLSCLNIFCVSQPLHWPHSTGLEHFSKVSLPQDLGPDIGKESTLSFSPKHPLIFTYTLTGTHTLRHSHTHTDMYSHTQTHVHILIHSHIHSWVHTYAHVLIFPFNLILIFKLDTTDDGDIETKGIQYTGLLTPRQHSQRKPDLCQGFFYSTISLFSTQI